PTPPWTREMPVVIGSVQAVQPVRTFRQIPIIEVVSTPLHNAGGLVLLFLSFLFAWIFGWTPWTGWTASTKSGTSCVQPKISTLDTLDRPRTDRCNGSSRN